MRLTAGIGPSALKDMQYEQPEYADAAWRTRITTIAPRVRQRLQSLTGRQRSDWATGWNFPLVDRVAQRIGVDATEVETVMAAHGVAAASVPAAQRSLQVARLRITGTKTGIPVPGPFDRTFEFPPGVVMVVGPNFCGKSSILEIITLCLRGTGRDLQSDVAAWLYAVECDVLMNGFALGIRLSLDAGDITHAAIYQAPVLDELPAAMASTHSADRDRSRHPNTPLLSRP